VVKVSVIVPVYNSQAYIDKLICSFNEQSCKDFVVYFVNDASTDNTLAILEQTTKTALFDHEIITLSTNGGAGHARNVGMQRVITPYFMFIDADDYISSNYIEELLCIAEKSHADIVVSSAVKTWSNGRANPHYDLEKFRKYLDQVEGLTCLLDHGPSGKIFKSHLWNEDTHFPTNIRSEDLSTIPVLYSKAKSIVFAPKAIYYYFQAEQSRSRAQGRFYNDIFLACQKLEERITNPVIMEFYYVTSIGYGVIMNAIQFGLSRNEVMRYVLYLRERFPKGYCNRYIKSIVIPKRVFIRCAYAGMFAIMKLMVKIAKRPPKGGK
jgi:glycosyltransferase involved in cell wall biosynthesis